MTRQWTPDIEGPLFDTTPEPHPDGATYEPKRDHIRLKGQRLRVMNAMRDGQARTLAQIRRVTGDPEASISTRLRDFRKAKFGGHNLIVNHVKSGLHLYRLVLAK